MKSHRRLMVPIREHDEDLERTPTFPHILPKPGPVTWSSLPRKSQLLILFLCRLVDFLQLASLQTYMFFQLQSFDASLTPAALSAQAGILQGAFTGAQVATAMLWGNAADCKNCGRKTVLLVGLAGTAVSCAGLAFARGFGEAVAWRVFGGAVNGTVGIIRTMIAEITVEKKYQSRAFLLLPMSFNVAGIIGPLMGGALADPAKMLPEWFGPGAMFEAQWIHKYPFALPGVLNAVFLTTVLAVVFFGLEETLEGRKERHDIGLELAGRFLPRRLRKPVTGTESLSYTEMDAQEHESKTIFRARFQKLSFRRIWTKNVICTLITTAFFDFHLGAFTNLWSLFLSAPRSPSTHQEDRSLSFSFNGGLGMPASTVGFATSILGMLGMCLQIFLYPPIQARLGLVRSFRIFLYLFPVAYFLAPWLALLSTTALIWTGIIVVLLLQVTARTFALPATIILLNNCSPHPSVLGTVHGIGQSVSASFRTIGPIVAGWWFGIGLEKGTVGLAWWGVAGAAAAGCVTGGWVYEGSGHEIHLEGEEAEEVEMEMEMESLLMEETEYVRPRSR